MTIVQLGRTTPLASSGTVPDAPFLREIVLGPFTTDVGLLSTFPGLDESGRPTIVITGVQDTTGRIYIQQSVYDHARSTFGSYYWDAVAQILYVNLGLTADPFTVRLTVGTAQGFSDTRLVYVDDVPYPPLVSSGVSVRQQQDIENYGELSFITGSVTLDNADGRLDELRERTVYGNDIVLHHLNDQLAETEIAPDPTGYYKLDDDYLDSSGNDNHGASGPISYPLQSRWPLEGSLTNAITASIYSMSVSAGTASYVAGVAGDALTGATLTYTSNNALWSSFSFWFKYPSALPAGVDLWGDKITSNCIYLATAANNAFLFGARDSTAAQYFETTTPDDTYVIGEWTHVVVTWGGLTASPRRVRLYVNSQLIATVNPITNWWSPSVMVKRLADQAATYAQHLDEVRHYTFEMKPLEVKAIYDDPLGAHEWVDGLFGRALSYGEGNPVYAYLVNVATNDLTISFWARVVEKNAPSNQWLFSHSRATGSGSRGIRITPSNTLEFVAVRVATVTEEVVVSFDASEWEAEEWIHVVFIQSGSTLTGYLNGARKSIVAPDLSTNFRTELIIGTGTGAAALDEMRIYDRPLAPTDVSDLYRYPAGGTVTRDQSTAVNFSSANLTRLATLFVEDYDISVREVSLRVQDRRKSQNRSIPDLRFTSASYPSAEPELIGEVVPVLWGTPREIPAIVTNGTITSGNVTYRAALLLTALGTVDAEQEPGVWTNVTGSVTGLDLGTGVFSLPAAAGRDASSGAPFAVRLTDPVGIPITHLTDVIIDATMRFSGIAYNSSAYDTAEWEAEEVAIANGAYYLDTTRPLFAVIADLQNGANVGFRYEITPGGLRTIRVDDEARAVAWTIETEEILNRDDMPVSTDSSMLAAEVVVAYGRSYQSGRELRVVDDSRAEAVTEAYSQRPRREYATLLTAQLDAEERAQFILDRFDSIRGTVTLSLLGARFLPVRIYDMIRVRLYPGAEREYYGEWSAKVVSVDPDPRSAVTTIEAQLVGQFVTRAIFPGNLNSAPPVLGAPVVGVMPKVVDFAITQVPVLDTDHEITLPSGIPEGNLIVILASVRGTISDPVTLAAAPAGFTTITDALGVGGGDVATGFIFAKVAVGSDSNPTLITGDPAKGAYLVWSIEGWDEGGGIAGSIEHGAWGTSNSTTFTAPALTNPWGSGIPAMVFQYVTKTTPATTPTVTHAYPDNQQAFISTGGDSASLAASSKEIAGDAAAAVTTQTLTNVVWKTVQVMIRGA